MDEVFTTLNKVPIGEKVIVLDILAKGKIRDRFFDLGVIKGTLIEVLQKSLFGDPTAYLIKGAVIALRNEDAKQILVNKS